MTTAKGKDEAGKDVGSKAQGGKGAAKASAATATAKCAICGKPRSDEYRPFCSKRCADVDLGRWLNGSYAIPVTEDADEDGEGAPAAQTEGQPKREPDRE